MSMQNAGFPVNRLSELRIDYPTLKVVRGHVSNGCARMLVLDLVGGVNPDGSRSGPYRVVINTTGLDRVPSMNIWDRGAPLSICIGNFSRVYLALEADPVVRMGAYLNHVISLLRPYRQRGHGV